MGIILGCATPIVFYLIGCFEVYGEENVCPNRADASLIYGC